MESRADHCQLSSRALRALAAALLAAASAGIHAQTCGGPLPSPLAPLPETQEKFKLISKQCNALAEPAHQHRAAQLDVYDRGASVTIRMVGDPEPAEAPQQVERLSSPQSSAAPTPVGRDGQRVLAVAPALDAAAREHGIDRLLLHAIAHVESRHNPAAVSPAGARGLMQVMPATGKRFGVAHASLLNDAGANARASAAYLATLRQRYGGDLRLMLAAYNAGEGAVDKYKGVPPYAETRAYVRDVLAIYRRLTNELRATS
jgi:soluble lytic murein transglycosylase-like protein